MKEITMEWTQFKDYFLPILTFFSLIYNIHNVIKRKYEIKSLKSHMQTEFNLHYNAARVCNRVRIIEASDDSDDKKLSQVLAEVNIIRGIADSARTNILSYSEQHLKFKPCYVHPSGDPVPNGVKHGKTPQQYKDGI